MHSLLRIFLDACRRPNSIPISCYQNLNLDGLLVKMWEMMALVIVVGHISCCTFHADVLQQQHPGILPLRHQAQCQQLLMHASMLSIVPDFLLVRKKLSFHSSCQGNMALLNSS